MGFLIHIRLTQLHLFLYFLNIPIISADIRLQTSGKDEHVFRVEEDCVQGVIEFKEPRQFTCACVKGIYSIFGKRCSKPIITQGGDNYCFPIEAAEISRIEFINKDYDPSLTILDSRTKYVKARYNRSAEYPAFRKGDTVIAVESWTLMKGDGSRVCLDVPDNQFCTYDKVSKFVAIKPGCRGKGKSLAKPTACRKIMGPTDFSSACQGPAEHRIVKRAMQGRVFIPAVIGMNPVPPSPPPEEKDEDYGVSAAAGSDIIKSQIWNYVAEKGASVLGMGTRLNAPKNYKTPAFQILVLSREVIKKTCPTYYVPHEHWDMTVESFIAMQQKSFRFRESMVDVKELNRIKAALLECASNSTLFPFLLQNETCVNGTNAGVVEDGTYIRYGVQQEMNIDWGSSSRHSEPIIESVWKVFVHVHSQCYEYFKGTRYNDHHRYTSILMPLFSNDAWDIWTKDGTGAEYKLEKGVYAGLLGNAFKLMDNVDYCSWTARLESTYPWDLPRPKQKQILPSNYRRKREVLNSEFGICSSLASGSEMC